MSARNVGSRSAGLADRVSSQNQLEQTARPPGQNRRSWTFHAFCQECRDRGFHLSAQRLVLLEVLHESFDHPDIATILKRVRSDKGQAIGHASIYRFLRDLQRIGILTRYDFSIGPARYALAIDERHDHMIEVVSGNIIEFASDELLKLLQAVASECGVRMLKYKLEMRCWVHKWSSLICTGFLLLLCVTGLLLIFQDEIGRAGRNEPAAALPTNTPDASLDTMIAAAQWAPLDNRCLRTLKDTRDLM